MSAIRNVHGTALLLGATGILLRGASGTGKSLLALALLDRWALLGKPAFLVADDRVDLERTGDSVVMHAPTRIAGLIELRGRGIVQRPHVGSAPLHLIIDLVPELVRMPETDAFRTDIDGVTIIRAPVPQAGVVDVMHQILLVTEAIAALSGDSGAP